MIYLQGVTGLRRGENENCLDVPRRHACLLPIASSAVHTKPTGSRLAIRHFTEYLEQFPDHLEVRWLLNLAHMTLAEYPDKVDPRFRLDLSRFFRSEFDIGAFRDVSQPAGGDRINQSGGAIMDDFDGDGRLDILITCHDPIQSMAFYRNAGDGTFAMGRRRRESPTRPAASSAIRPITTTTVGSMSSSPAVPGTSGRCGRRSCTTRAAADSRT